MKYLIPIFFCVALVPLKSQSIWLKGYAGIGRGPRLQIVHTLEPRLYISSNNGGAAVFAMPAIVLEDKKGDFLELSFAWENRNTPNDNAIVRVPPADSIKFVDTGASKYKRFEGQIEFNLHFKRDQEKRWQTGLGFGLNPHWSRLDFSPHQTYFYPMTARLAGVNWGIIPRIQYKLTKNLVLDFNAALFFLSTNYEYTKVENPVLTPNQQESSVFEVDLLRQYWLRVGLAYKIWGKKVEN